MAANNKTQMVLSHDNNIIVSTGNGRPAAACDVSLEHSVKFIYPIRAYPLKVY